MELQEALSAKKLSSFMESMGYLDVEPVRLRILMPSRLL